MAFGGFTRGGSPAGGLGSTPWTNTSIGSQNPSGELYNPETGRMERSGAQKGANAGQALKALAEASGLSLLGSSSSAGGSASGAGAAGAPMVSMPDTSAANANAYARAKDQTGLNTRAALTGLQNELGANQMLGSGLEMGATTDIIGRGQAGLNEVSREQAVQDAVLGDKRAMADYQGRVTQRGQDISVAQANANRQQQALEGLLSVINSSGILY